MLFRQIQCEFVNHPVVWQEIMYLVPKFGQIFELKMANTLTTADDGVGAYFQRFENATMKNGNIYKLKRKHVCFACLILKRSNLRLNIIFEKKQLFSFAPFWLVRRSTANLSLYFALASVENYDDVFARIFRERDKAHKMVYVVFSRYITTFISASHIRSFFQSS